MKKGVNVTMKIRNCVAVKLPGSITMKIRSEALHDSERTGGVTMNIVKEMLQ